MPRRSKIPRRRRLFIGCEGESEQGYAALLQRFAKQIGLAVYLDAKVMTKSGDPLALVERAKAVITQAERGNKQQYKEYFLLLDTDLIGQNLTRDRKMYKIARQSNLQLVRQDCCFEAFLLRHFDGHENDRPPTATIALDRLQNIWPEYNKGTPAQELANHLTLEDVQRAAINPNNTDFAPLFRAIRLIS